MNFKIKTLTPIWTGNIDKKCEKLRETSIIGSLRWWFETMVRGFGYYACDPTSENSKCIYDNKDMRSICPVCQIFGCTGWGRRFRLEINQSFRSIYEDNLRIKGKNREWYYPSGVVSCNGKDNKLIKTLSGGEYLTDEEYESIIKILLKFISNYGMVGGKTAIGYGVVKFEGDDIKTKEKDFENLFNYLDKKKNHGGNSNNVPRLDEMFFANFKIKNKCLDKIIENLSENITETSNLIYKYNGTEEKINDKKEFLKRLKNCYGFIPTSALIRKELRGKMKSEEWKGKENEILRHFLMGELRRFSAIQVSHIYYTRGNWEFRIWGWIPRNLDKKFNIQREEVISFLMSLLNSENFWKNIFENDFIEKINGNCIIKYSDNENNWNFIDFGDLENLDERKKAFESMLRG